MESSAHLQWLACAQICGEDDRVIASSIDSHIRSQPAILESGIGVAQFVSGTRVLRLTLMDVRA
jgi:hypothetical protein